MKGFHGFDVFRVEEISLRRRTNSEMNFKTELSLLFVQNSPHSNHNYQHG